MTPDQKEITYALMNMAFKPGSAVCVKLPFDANVFYGAVYSLGENHFTLVVKNHRGDVACADYEYGHKIVDEGWILD